MEILSLQQQEYLESIAYEIEETIGMERSWWLGVTDVGSEGSKLKSWLFYMVHLADSRARQLP